MLLTICRVSSDASFHHFAELAQIKSTPTDSELAVQIDETESKVRRVAHQPTVPPVLSCIITPPNTCAHVFFFTFRVFSRQVAKLREHLEPLRAGTPLVSAVELNALDAEWTKWRSEWIKRRKVFCKCASPSVFSPFISTTEHPLTPSDVIIFYI